MNKHLKVFIDAHVFDHEYQGSRTYIKELYNELTKNEQITFYFAAHDVQNLKKEIVLRDNVNFVKYTYRSSTMRLLFELPYLLKKLSVDFAHFQYIVPPIKVCKYIVTTHDVIFHDYPEEFSWKYRFTKHWLYNISAKMADILTTVSEFSKKSINRFFEIPLQNIHVIPNAVGKNFFDFYDIEESKKIIRDKFNIEKFVVVVSRIEPRKNHVMVLKAFQELSLFEKGYSLVFIGRESLVDPLLSAEIAALNNEQRNKYHHIEGISEVDLINFYNAADLSIYPSKAEGFGIPPLESACLEVQTLCSNKSAMEDFSFFGDNHFDPGNLDELKEKMKKILLDKQSNVDLKEVHYQVASRYSWNISSKHLQELLFAF